MEEGQVFAGAARWKLFSTFAASAELLESLRGRILRGCLINMFMLAEVSTLIPPGPLLQVWHGMFWMGLFQGPTPKRHRIWSNDWFLVDALMKRAGMMPRHIMDSFSTTLVRKYVDKHGVQRRVGKKHELKASQSLALDVS